MNTYTLTKNGATWMANRLCNTANTPDITVMYLVYSNGSAEYIDFDVDFSTDSLNNLPDDSWYVRKSGGLVTYAYNTAEGTAYAAVSGVFGRSDVSESEGRPELISGSSKIIAVAIGYVDKNNKDVIIAASNLGSSQTRWVDNMSMSLTCPIAISSYTGA